MSRTIKQEIFSAHEDALSTLAAAFPEAIKDGEVDWDALKEILADAPSTGPEKYELTWAGKAEAKREAGRDVVGRTLRFCPEESKDAETTQNLYIEGDNLEVLKLLRENYYGAVKMIYIDPPYNTGGDFIYRDNFTQSEEQSELAEGIIDDEGQRLIKNPRSSNRFHAEWLSMMYPRLRLARDVLTQDGVIFISIDDNEIHNARYLCNEIFGEENFIDCLIWKKRYGGGAKEKHLVTLHEYVLFYARNINYVNDIFIPLSPVSIERYYTKKDENFERLGPYRTHPLEAVKSMDERKNLIYPIIAPDGSEIYPKKQWLWSKERVENAVLRGELEFSYGKNGWSISTKQYLNNEDGEIRGAKAFSIIDDIYTQHGTNEMIDIFDNAKVFPFPKPTEFIKKLIEIGIHDKNSIALDFFSGSGTTAHSILKLNAEDGGNRKFICVQYPVPLADDTEGHIAGFGTIAEIGKTRISHVCDAIKSEHLTPSLFDNETNLDLGYKVFKTADTVIRWTHDALRSGGQMILDEAAMSDKDRLDFMPGFTDIDVVYEIALRQNDIPLSSPVRPVPEAGKRTYLFADSILVCLEEAITPELVEALAAIQPTPNKFILRDSAFEDDIALKDETLRRLQACVARNTKDAKASYVVDFI